MEKIVKDIFEEGINKVIISNLREKSNDIKRIVVDRKDNYYQVCNYYDEKVIHKNISEDEIVEFVIDKAKSYKQFNVYTLIDFYEIKISKKFKVLVRKFKNDSEGFNVNHNKEKNYLFKEGDKIYPLVELGVFTEDYKIVKSKYDKFKQINRYIEIIDDVIKKEELKSINIVDFGCGKSYLTFIVYHYFKVVRNIDVKIVGLDLKKDVINECKSIALKYNYNIEFKCLDINEYKPDFDVDMVMTLHACDIATDLALYNAIKWGVKYIFSVPCCQHEVNGQIESNNKIITDYGIAKERISAIYTDIIRCNLLKGVSYKTQLLEFIDIDNTPKNLLIRAVLSNQSEDFKKEKIGDAERLMKDFNFDQTLYEKLKDDNLI